MKDDRFTTGDSWRAIDEVCSQAANICWSSRAEAGIDACKSLIARELPDGRLRVRGIDCDGSSLEALLPVGWWVAYRQQIAENFANVVDLKELLEPRRA